MYAVPPEHMKGAICSQGTWTGQFPPRNPPATHVLGEVDGPRGVHNRVLGVRAVGVHGNVLNLQAEGLDWGKGREESAEMV